MIYPFIYTRTKSHDYRVVTSLESVRLPESIEQMFLDIANTMIKANDKQLLQPSWVFVRKEGYLLWGMSTMNKELGTEYLDNGERPVRGFFGIISDGEIDKLPYNIEYFKELYQTFVSPIWESYSQMKKVSCMIPSFSGAEFIRKSSRFKDQINIKQDICRLFPDGIASEPLIEAVFDSSYDCSIATNIHTKSQCIEFGKEKISFANVIMASDSSIGKIEDVKVYLPKEETEETDQEEEINNGLEYDNSERQTEFFCKKCGCPISDNKLYCADCKHNEKREKYLRNSLYGLIILIVILYIFKDSNIWDKLTLSEEANKNNTLLDKNDKDKKINVISPQGLKETKERTSSKDKEVSSEESNDDRSDKSIKLNK